jgi:hypothetical protein
MQLNETSFEITIYDNDETILNTISIIDLVIIIIGTIGNLTSFYLLRRKRILNVSSMRYLASLTLTDTVCLYGWYLSSVYRQLSSEQVMRIENINTIFCKFISYISFSSLQLSSILLLMLTIDRLLIMVSSKWRSKYTNKRFANKLILIVVLFVFVLNFFIPITLGNKGIVTYKLKYLKKNHLNNVKNVSMCHCYDDNHQFLKFWNKLHLFLYALLPFPILLALNLIVIYLTADAAKSASEISATNYKRFKSGQNFVTRLLIFLTLSFFFTTLPSTLIYAFYHQQILKLRYGRVTLNLLNTLQFSRHGLNWIIYLYSSSYMREELKKCMACKTYEFKMAEAALAERPSILIEILRQQLELNNTSDQEFYNYYYNQLRLMTSNNLNDENNDNDNDLNIKLNEEDLDNYLNSELISKIYKEIKLKQLKCNCNVNNNNANCVKINDKEKQEILNGDCCVITPLNAQQFSSHQSTQQPIAPSNTLVDDPNNK